MSEKFDRPVVSDLFGDVVTLPSGRRGRPAHCWSKSSADKVMLGLAAGYELPEIAKGLGISLPTLRKYYFSELKQSGSQRIRLEFWRMHQLAEMANEGNVGAIKELGKILEKRDTYLAAKAMRDDPPAREPLGKKEAARQAANGQVTEDPDLTPGLWH